MCGARRGAVMIMMLAGALSGSPYHGAGQVSHGDGASEVPSGGHGATASRVFSLRAATTDLRIDGMLDEPAWRDAPLIDLPYEIAPGDNTPARFRTDCRVTFDEQNLYLGCRAFDPDPSSIRAYVTDRDRILGNHDRISFLVDPFDDRRRGWVFEVSALGVQADLVYDERTSSFDTSWDAIWSSAGHIDENGYVVEAAIPFRSLRFPSSSAPQTWRFWINRMRPRDQMVTMRSNTRLRDESCQLCQANALEGLQGMDPGRNLELVPTLTASRNDLPQPGTVEGAPIVAGDLEWEPGFDARWSPTTDLTLNATVNPDFSQVEADAPQLTANNRFALFFPEKRPFFLEGADLFSTPISAVFTRTMVEPVAGAKLTGKAGSNAFGALVAHDRVNGLLLPGAHGSSSRSLDEDVTSTLLRYRRDVGATTTVGAIGTLREGGSGYHNRVVGADAFFRPMSTLRVNLQLLASRTRYADDLAEEAGLPSGAFGGTAYAADVSYDDGDWGFFTGTNVREGGFRADAGFVPQVDTRSTWGNVVRTFWGGEGDLFTRISGRTGFWRERTLAGGLIAEAVWAQIDFEGPLQSHGWVNPSAGREHADGTDYDVRGLNAGLNLRPWRDLQVGLHGYVGDAIDFRNSRAASSLRLSPNVELRLGRNLEVRASHSIHRLTAEDRDILTENAGQLQAVYNFGPRSFLRGTLQYRRTKRDPATNPGLERTIDEQVSAQALFSYKVNPLTVLFVGTSDDRAGFSDLEGQRSGLEPRARSLFVKLGYAWRP